MLIKFLVTRKPWIGCAEKEEATFKRLLLLSQYYQYSSLTLPFCECKYQYSFHFIDALVKKFTLWNRKV